MNLRILLKKVKDFKCTLLIPEGFENINSFYYAILYAIQYQLKNKKIWCQNDDERKRYIDMINSVMLYMQLKKNYGFI